MCLGSVYKSLHSIDVGFLINLVYRRINHLGNGGIFAKYFQAIMVVTSLHESR